MNILEKIGKVLNNVNEDSEKKLNITAEDVEAIDFSGLEKELSKLFGTSIKLTSKLNGKFLDVKSQELIDHAGIFSKVYTSAKITDFGSGLWETNGNKMLTLQLNISYELKRGSNGAPIGRFMYDFNKKKWAADLM